MMNRLYQLIIDILLVAALASLFAHFAFADMLDINDGDFGPQAQAEDITGTFSAGNRLFFNLENGEIAIRVSPDGLRELKPGTTYVLPGKDGASTIIIEGQ